MALSINPPADIAAERAFVTPAGTHACIVRRQGKKKKSALVHAREIRIKREIPDIPFYNPAVENK